MHLKVAKIEGYLDDIDKRARCLVVEDIGIDLHIDDVSAVIAGIGGSQSDLVSGGRTSPVVEIQLQVSGKVGESDAVLRSSVRPKRVPPTRREAPNFGPEFTLSLTRGSVPCRFSELTRGSRALTK